MSAYSYLHDLAYFAVMEADDERPVLKNFTGDWSVDPKRSDNLEPLFASMNISWLARKLVSSVKIDTHIFHTRESYITTDNSMLGAFTMTLVPDGKWRDVIQVDKATAKTRCSMNRETGELKIETQFPSGLLVDRRTLLSRTCWEQVLCFSPSSYPLSSPDPSAPLFTRFFLKVETEEEAAAGEEAEEAARMMLAHQAATLGLVAAPVSISMLTSPASIVMPPGSTPVVASVATPSAVKEVDGRGAGSVESKSEGATAGVGSAAAPVCDFSGSWILDRSKSDTLDAMLTLMGLPWVARVIANKIEITAVLKHDVAGNGMLAEDHSSMGITTLNYAFDGQPKQITSKEGKVSTITAAVVPVPLPPIPGSGEAWAAVTDPELKHAYGCIRILTILPDGAGETVDTRCIIEEGRVMRQHLEYTKGSGKDAGKKATMIRYLNNQHYDAAAFKKSVVDMHNATPQGASTTSSGAPSTPARAAAAETPASPVAEGSSTPGIGSSKPGPDPFFISLAGTWGTDLARSESFDALWSSIGVGWLTRKVAGMYEITTTISHSKKHLRIDEKSSLGTHTQNLELGKWCVVRQPDGKHYLTKAVQVLGGGDKGSTWLGDIGFVPTAWIRHGHSNSVDESGFSDDDSDDGEGAAKAGHASLIGEAHAGDIPLKSIPVQVPLLLTAEVVVTSILNDITSRKDEFSSSSTLEEAGDSPLGPCAALEVRYRMERRDEVETTYRHLDSSGTELIRVVRTIVRKESAEQRTVAQIAESARIQHGCTLLVARRAAADDLRQLYLRRKEEAMRRVEARRVAAIAAAQRVRSARLAAGEPDAHPDDAYELGDGVQCLIQ